MSDNIYLIFDFDEESNINYKVITFKKTNTCREAIEKFLRINNLKMDYSTEYITFWGRARVINNNRLIDERLSQIFGQRCNATIEVFTTGNIIG